MRTLILIAIFSIFAPLVSAESLLLSLGVVQEGTDSARIAQKLAEEISRRSGIDITLVTFPDDRLVELLKAGKIDGDFSRIGGFEKSIPGLIQIPEPLGSFAYFAYTMKDDIRIDGWESLNKYSVAYITGSKTMATKLKPIHNDLYPVKTTEAGLNFLAAGRSDIFVHITFLVAPLLEKEKVKYGKIKALGPQLDFIQTHIHLLPKHAKLASKIDTTLKAMKDDKTYDKLLRELD